jgi:hypothetical protein
MEIDIIRDIYQVLDQIRDQKTDQQLSDINWKHFSIRIKPREKGSARMLSMPHGARPFRGFVPQPFLFQSTFADRARRCEG